MIRKIIPIKTPMQNNIKTIAPMVKRPFLLGSALFFIGFTVAFLNKSKKIVDNELAGFIRKFQYNRILKRVQRRNLHEQTTR